MRRGAGAGAAPPPAPSFRRVRAAPRARALLGLLACVGPAALASPGVAQTPTRVALDSALLAPLHWRNIGPERAGRSIAVAGVPSRPFEYYAGFAGGGLWKTTDGGTTWRPVTDGWIRSSSVGAVAVAESDPDVVYVGMGEAQIQRNSLQGDGVYGSRDGGRTWTHLGLDDSQVIARIRVHPTDPDVVYAAVLGHPWGPSEERGVYRSRDGGRSWRRILYRDADTGAVDLAIDRAHPDVLYAALWRATVAPGGTVTGGPGSGLFRTTDGGESWTELTASPGMPRGAIGSIGVSVSGADPRRVYALVDADDGGVLRSDDGGDTWTLVNDDGPLRQRPSYFNRIQADPGDADVVYVMNLQLFRSTDAGRSYEIVTTPHVDYHDVWIAPGDPRRMAVANDGGPTVSVNRGESWTGQAIPTAQLYNVGTTRDVPYHVCGPQQDEAAVCVPSSQARWRSSSPYVGSGDLGGALYAPGGGEFGRIVPHPRDPNLFFATGPNVVTRYDRRTGLVHARDIQVAPLTDRGPDRERFTQIAPLVFSPTDANVLYAGSQHLWRLDASTSAWARVSPDLTRGARGGTEASGSIFAIAPSPGDAATVWVGSDDGLVHLTRDGGGSWRDVTPPGLPGPAKISAIEASAHEPGRAYVAAHRYEFDDRAPYVFETRDYGATWTRIVAGIGATDYVHVVREDPVRAGLLYAGAEHGVHVSLDDGASWQPLSLDLPDVSVPDLVVEGGDLVIATQGRSFWVLEGIGPLRELSREVVAAPLHLFRPRPAVRRLAPAVVDYLLARDAASVRIEVLDSTGAVVRSFGDPTPSGGRPAARATGADAPPRRAGLNRFRWDLRYEDAAVFPGMILWVGSADGPIAAPGRYRVRVTADGITRTQELEVTRDPALADVTDADVRAQFDLALAARDRMSEANRGVARIRDLRAQLEDRRGRAPDPPVAAATEALLGELGRVEGQLYQVRLRSQLDAITYPVMLNNRLANLKLSIETGDGRPTPQQYAAYEQLSGELRAQLERLGELVGTDLADFNRLIVGRGLPAVEAR